MVTFVIIRTEWLHNWAIESTQPNEFILQLLSKLEYLTLQVNFNPYILFSLLY